MATSFPGALDSFPLNTDNVDIVTAADINNIQDAVVAVETILSAGVVAATSAATNNALMKRNASAGVSVAALTATAGALLPKSGGTAVWAIDASGTGSDLAILNNATAQPFGAVNNFSGLLMIFDTAFDGISAMFLCGAAATTLVAGSSTYSATASAASKVSVYYSSSVLTIENKSGANRILSIFAIRMRTTT